MNDSDRIKELEAEVAKLKRDKDTAEARFLVMRGGHDHAMKDLVYMKAENIRLSEELGKAVSIIEHAKKHGHIGFQKIENHDGTWHDWRDDVDAFLTSLSKGMNR